MLANWIFMSRAIYMIRVWSSCTKEMLNSLQVIQNRAARLVTKNDLSVNNHENLRQVGWLSLNQLSHYHSVVQLQSIRRTKTPKNLYSMHNWDNHQLTRQSVQNKIKPIGVPRLDISSKSFRWRSSLQYNQVPHEITNLENKSTFKKQLKCWIQENISFRRWVCKINF